MKGAVVVSSVLLALLTVVAAVATLSPGPRVAAAITPAPTPSLVAALPSPFPSPSPAGFDVCASTRGGQISPLLKGIQERVYVPNSTSTTVTVIDPHTYAVIDHLQVGQIPHHVAPAWDLSKLYVDNEGSSSLSVIDPVTGKLNGSISVPYPYNIYFTPDGKKAIDVVERLSRIDFRDPTTWALIKSVPIPWPGVDHMDFSADGSFVLMSTEWSGMVVKVDTNLMQIVGTIDVGALPIDIKLLPDGSRFYVSNQGRHGVSIVDAVALKEVGFIPTGRGAHGLGFSRDCTKMYVTNRLAGSISVIDIATSTVVATWQTGGSPDMIQLSPDGTELWTSSRYDGYVIVVDTRTGAVTHRIYSGPGAHGLSYFPNVGAHSVGHNGVYR